MLRSGRACSSSGRPPHMRAGQQAALRLAARAVSGGGSSAWQCLGAFAAASRCLAAAEGHQQRSAASSSGSSGSRPVAAAAAPARPQQPSPAPGRVPARRLAVLLPTAAHNNNRDGGAIWADSNSTTPRSSADGASSGSSSPRSRSNSSNGSGAASPRGRQRWPLVAPPRRPPRPRTLVQPQATPPRPRSRAAAAAAPAPVEAPVGNVVVCGKVVKVVFNSDDGFKIVKLKVQQQGSKTHESAGEALVAEGDALLQAAARGSKVRTKIPPSAEFPNGRDVWQPQRLVAKGQLPGVSEGMELQLDGEWERHTERGLQVKVLSFSELPPSDAFESLTSLKGIGPVTAQAIVATLGADQVLQLLAGPDAVEALTRVKGISIKKAQLLKQEWDKKTTSGTLQAYQWLQQQGLKPSHATAISSRLGAAALEAVQGNPYDLISWVPGFRLADADALAQQLQLDPGSPQRAAAVLQHVLLAAASDAAAATGLTWHHLEQSALQKLGRSTWPWPGGAALQPGAQLLLQDGRIVVERVQQQQQQQPPGEPQQAPLWRFEPVAPGEAWGDDVLVSLQELHSAEQDIVAFMVAASEACQRKVAQLHKAWKAADSSSSSKGRRSASSSSSISSSSSSSSFQAFVEQLGQQPAVAEMVQQRESELSSDLGRPVQLNGGQRAALALALHLPALVLTGGPGCGKTLVSQAVARAWLRQGKALKMAAPTGRAAQRLQELVCGGSSSYSAAASTVHRLLGYRSARATAAAAVAARDAQAAAVGSAAPAAAAAAASKGGGLEDVGMGRLCEFNRDHKLPGNRVLIDETSMMDAPMTAALLGAIRHDASLMLVGDPDQLPPVGPGRPLAAALAAGLLPCVDLKCLYRTGAGSTIAQAAHTVNQGVVPELPTWRLHPADLVASLAEHLAAARGPSGRLELPGDALLLQLPDTASDVDVAAAVTEVVQQLLPQLGIEPARDVQVLSPTKLGAAGSLDLADRLQPLLNPAAAGKAEVLAPSRHHHHHRPRGAPVWRVGDRVIHLVNDVERDVMNGDLGYVVSVDAQRREVHVHYPPRGGGSDAHSVAYSLHDAADELQLAWATTVHKAQGVEFPVVVLPLHGSAGAFLLRRPLLYTGVSRAKRLLVLVGTQAALQLCVRNAGADAGWLGGRRQSQSVPQLVDRLRAAAAAKGLQPFPRLVFGQDGWR